MALCAASAKSDHGLIEKLLAAHGRDLFLENWLRARDLDWAAELIADLPNLERPKRQEPPAGQPDDDLAFELLLKDLIPTDKETTS